MYASTNTVVIAQVDFDLFPYEFFIAMQKALECEDGKVYGAHGYQRRSLN